ncbi:phosphatase PAP2 family protein [Eubacteriales bacterium KG127]
MYNKVLGFRRWYDRKFSCFLPWRAALSLFGCFLLNCTIYWFTQWVMEDIYHYDFTLSFDKKVPVVPWWGAIYLLSYIFWAANYIIISRISEEKCYRLVVADYISKIVCGIIFIVIPTTNVRPVVSGNGLGEQILNFIYSMDSPTNLFPSIHCLVSWLCYIGLRGTTAPRWYKLFSFVTAIAICASTQFTKQHYIVDVLGGIILAEIAFGISTYFSKRKFDKYK